MGQNSTEVAYGFGQMGSLFTNLAKPVYPPKDHVIIAIQFLENTTFDATNTTADTSWATRSQVGPGTNGEAFGGATFLAGMTIYGRWDTLGIDSGSCLLYLG